MANPPSGILDGLAVCHLVSQGRPDVRILVNSVLCRADREAFHKQGIPLSVRLEDPLSSDALVGQNPHPAPGHNARPSSL